MACILAISVTQPSPSVAQSPSADAIQKLIEAAQQAESARQRETAEIRALLQELARRGDALEAQVRASLEMQAQVLALSVKSMTQEAKAAAVDEGKRLVAEGRKALDDALDGLKRGKSRAEQELGSALEKLKGTLPSDEEIASLSKEKLEEIKSEIEKIKREVEDKAREFVKGLGDDLRKQCPKADSSAILVAAQQGATRQELEALSAGCNMGADLLDRLANAKNAEEAKAAFQATMSSMMMLAVYSGNPYVIAIVAVISIVAALLSDGGGGSGEGEGEGAGNGGNQVGDGEPGNGEGQGDKQDPDNPAPTEPNPPTPATEVQIQAGSGCTVHSPDGDVLSIVPNSGAAYSISLKAITGDRPDNFPTKWTDPTIRVSTCEPDTKSLAVWLSPQGRAFCYIIHRVEGKYKIADESYAKENTIQSCQPFF